MVNQSYLNNAESVELAPYYERGFLSVEREILFADENRITELNRYKKFLLNDTSNLMGKSKILHENNSKKYEYHDLNRIHLNRINSLIEKAKSKDIHLIVIMMRERPTNKIYHEIIPVFDAIQEGHKIELANSKKKPRLFDLSLWWDKDRYKLASHHDTGEFKKKSNRYFFRGFRTSRTSPKSICSI